MHTGFSRWLAVRLCVLACAAAAVSRCGRAAVTSAPTTEPRWTARCVARVRSSGPTRHSGRRYQLRRPIGRSRVLRARCPRPARVGPGFQRSSRSGPGIRRHHARSRAFGVRRRLRRRRPTCSCSFRAASPSIQSGRTRPRRPLPTGSSAATDQGVRHRRRDRSTRAPSRIRSVATSRSRAIRARRRLRRLCRACDLRRVAGALPQRRQSPRVFVRRLTRRQPQTPHPPPFSIIRRAARPSLLLLT